MYNILVVSEDPTPFSELTDHLRREFFSVYQYRCDEIIKSNDEMRQYDFSLLHLEQNNMENINRIQEVKNIRYVHFTFSHPVIRMIKSLNFWVMVQKGILKFRLMRILYQQELKLC